MKVEIQNKKGLTTILSIIIDKKIIQEELDKKYDREQLAGGEPTAWIPGTKTEPPEPLPADELFNNELEEFA